MENDISIIYLIYIFARIYILSQDKLSDLHFRSYSRYIYILSTRNIDRNSIENRITYFFFLGRGTLAFLGVEEKKKKGATNFVTRLSSRRNERAKMIKEGRRNEDRNNDWNDRWIEGGGREWVPGHYNPWIFQRRDACWGVTEKRTTPPLLFIALPSLLNFKPPPPPFLSRSAPRGGASLHIIHTTKFELYIQ